MSDDTRPKASTNPSRELEDEGVDYIHIEGQEYVPVAYELILFDDENRTIEVTVTFNRHPSIGNCFEYNGQIYEIESMSVDTETKRVWAYLQTDILIAKPIR